MPESEPQKQGIAASGCSFSLKAEHVPIKKRRFLFRSPSPPPKETILTESEGISDRVCSTSESNLCSNDKNVSIGVQNSDKSDGKFGEDEAFSGISILAAAACSSSLGSDYGNAEHGTAVEDSSVTHGPSSVSTNVNAAPLSKEFFKEELLSSSVLSSARNLSCITTEAVGELVSISNAVNLPPEVVADINFIKGASMGVGSCQKDEEIVVSHGISSPDVKFSWDLNVVMDAWEEPLNDTQHVVVDNTGLHDKRVIIACTEQCSMIPGEQNFSVDDQASAGRKGNQDAYERSPSASQTVYSNASDHATRPSTSDGLNKADNTTVKTLNLNSEKRHYDQLGVVSDSMVAVSSSEVKNLGTLLASDAACDVSFCMSSKKDTVNDVAQNVAFSKDTQGSVSDRKLLPDSSCELQMALFTTGFSENSLLMPEEPHDSHFGETSQGNLRRCLKYFTRDEDCAEHTDYNDDVIMRRDTMAVGGSDVLPVRRLEDFESQYEDGELQESTEREWKEEYDYVDREHEHVDYGSDNPSDYHDIESGYVVSSGDCYVDNQGCKLAEDYKGADKDNTLNLRLLSAEKTEALGETVKNKISPDVTYGVADNRGKKDRLSTPVDTFVNSKRTEINEEPKVFKRALQSRIEGPISRDNSSRDDRPFRAENRFESGSTRSFESGRYSYHNRGRGRQGGNWDGLPDYNRCKRHYSPINRRCSNLNNDDVIERDDVGCGGNPDNASYSYKPSRTGITIKEGPSVGLQSRYRPDRKLNCPDRNAGFGRGRPFRYNDPDPSPDESFQSSLKHRRPFSGRERNPFAGRGQSNMNHFRGKSPSRSRSRSPLVWGSPRERPNIGRGSRTFVTHRSRSPNFRSEVRIQRVRSPNHHLGFGNDQAAGFRHNRWNSKRKDDDVANFRERSPDRFRPRERDRSIGSPRNPKTDIYKFSERISEDDDSRGVRYAGHYEERRKPSNFPRSGRRDFNDVEDDDFPNNSNNIRNIDGLRFRGRGGFRSIDSRIDDIQKRVRRDQESFYERDGKFTDDVMNSRNLKSENQFNRNHLGRYDDMGCTNHGHRYDNYDDRRKQQTRRFHGRIEN